MRLFRRHKKGPIREFKTPDPNNFYSVEIDGVLVGKFASLDDARYYATTACESFNKTMAGLHGAGFEVIPTREYFIRKYDSSQETCNVTFVERITNKYLPEVYNDCKNKDLLSV